MKRFLLPLALLFSVTLARAESQAVGGSFGGLNNGDSSILINDNEAQDLQDVDITPNGYGIAKRAGTVQYKTMTVSTSPVRGGYFFRDASGNDNIIHAQDISVCKSVAGGEYSCFYTTATLGSYWQFTDSNGTLYGANSAKDKVFTYNGTTLQHPAGIPQGSLITMSPDRLIVSGVTANPNRVYFSGAADLTNFTVGNLDTSPFYEDVGLPGQNVTAIKYAMGRLLIWTNNTMSYFVWDTQFEGAITDISQTVGCTQPDTVLYENGMIYFQGSDGHFYQYDGQSLTRLSSKIAGSVADFMVGRTGSLSQTTQADWEAGTLGTGLSASDSPGDVVFGGALSGEKIDDFTDGDYSSAPVWTSSTTGDASFSATSNTLDFTASAGTSNRGTIITANTYSTGTWSFSYTGLGGSEYLTMYLSTWAYSGYNSSLDKGGYHLQLGGGGVYLYKFTGSFVPIVDVGFSIPTDGAISLSRNSSGQFVVYINNDYVGSGTDTTYSSLNYILFDGYSASWAVDDITFTQSTATFQSQVLSIGSGITSWGLFQAHTVTDGGTHSFVMYTDSNTAITIGDNTTFTSSQTITSGSIPTLATATYVTIVDNFSRTLPSQEPALNDFTVNWNVGSEARHYSTADKDHRLMWAVAESGSAVPNKTYIFDPRFGSWLKYSQPFQAPARYGDSIYYGGVSTGVVYMYPSGNSDNGSAINAYWKSKDFLGGDGYVEKDYNAMSLLAKSQTGSNIDLTYTVNTSSSVTNTFSLTDSDGNTIKRINYNLPSGTFGTFFNYQIGNNLADSPFEVYGFKFDFTPRPWRVIP